MPDLTKLAHQLDAKEGVCRVIVETSKGRRSKYDYDRKVRCFRLKTVLPEGMSFPLDFGFVPSTLAGDGDPLDVMILADEPAPMGALLEVRLVGVIEAEEREDGRTERNDRLLAVATATRLYAAVRSPGDLPEQFIDQLSDFWIQKDRLEGKVFKPLAVREAPAAIELVRQASKAARKAA